MRFVAPTLLISAFGLLAVLFGSYATMLDYHRKVTFMERRTDGVVLASRIRSYMSVDDFLFRSRDLGSSRPIVRRFPDQATSAQPSLQSTEVEIDGFSDCAYRGSLFAYFLNDRLSEIHFYGPDPEGYFRCAAARLGAMGTESHREIVVDRVRIEIATDAAGKSYVRVADTRLDDEETLWIMRYS